MTYNKKGAATGQRCHDERGKFVKCSSKKAVRGTWGNLDPNFGALFGYEGGSSDGAATGQRCHDKRGKFVKCSSKKAVRGTWGNLDKDFGSASSAGKKKKKKAAAPRKTVKTKASSSSAGEVLWYFQWTSGGYNSVMAKTKAEAVKKAKELGKPSVFYVTGERYGIPMTSPTPKPGAKKTTTKGLTPDESTFEKATDEVIRRYDRAYAGMFD